MDQAYYHIYKEISSQNNMLTSSTILSILGLALYILFPILVARFLHTSLSTLSLKAQSDLWGTLYGNLRYQSFPCLLYLPLFCLRRIIFSLTLVLLPSHPTF